MENNNFTTPAPEDIPIHDPDVVAAPEKAEETAAPGKTEVAAAKKPPLKFILIGAAAPCGGHRCGRDSPEPQQSVLRGQALCAGLLHR